MKKKLLTILLFMTICLVLSGCSKNKNDENASTDNITIIPQQEDTQDVTPIPTSPAATTAPEEPTASTETTLFPAFREDEEGNRLYGYVDLTGNFVIQPAYTIASNFSDHRAVVYDSDQYYVIDEKGTIIFTNDYQITPYVNGFATFTEVKDNKYLNGYIDTNGTIVIKPQFLMTSNFTEEHRSFVTTDPTTLCMIDETGTILETYPLDERYQNYMSISDGYIIYSDGNGKVGVIDYKGNTIFEPNFSQITYLKNGFFAMKEITDELFNLESKPAALYSVDSGKLTEYTLYDVNEFINSYTCATDSTSTFFINEKGEREKTLPEFTGIGTLNLLSKIIQANVDGDLIYMTTDGTILWENSKTQVLSSNIKVTKNKFRSCKYVLVTYPVLEGLADQNIQDMINTKIYELFTQSRAQLTEADLYNVEDTFHAKLEGDLLEVKKTGYDYPFGAAHGMPVLDYYYFNLTTGDFYTLKDLFLPESGYIDYLNQMITAQIEDKKSNADSMILIDHFEGIGEKPNFYLTDDSLVIYFYPYEIAAYAAGFPEFSIPYEDLKGYINEDGGLWKAFVQ
ncbi:MAG: repeat-containing protein [Herbinix sp.]|nr:repeat-containing protein [Herbinix sp.]